MILMTSSHVLAETYTWLRYKTSYGQAQKFISLMQQSATNHRLQVIYDDVDLLRDTNMFLTHFPDQKLSYVDALNMAVMKERKITNIFSFDHHFYLIDANILPAGGTL